MFYVKLDTINFLTTLGSVDEKAATPSENKAVSPVRMDSPKIQSLNGIRQMSFIPPPPFLPQLPGLMPPPPINSVDLGRPIGRFMTSSHSNIRYSPDDHYNRDRYSPRSKYHDDYSIITSFETETEYSPPSSPK